jgi:hypothetical protein
VACESLPLSVIQIPTETLTLTPVITVLAGRIASRRISLDYRLIRLYRYPRLLGLRLRLPRQWSSRFRRQSESSLWRLDGILPLCNDHPKLNYRGDNQLNYQLCYHRRRWDGRTTKQSILDGRTTSFSRRDDFLRNNQFSSIGNWFILLDGIMSDMIIDESFEMQNQNRRESLDKDLLGSSDNTFTRSVLGYRFRFVKLPQGVGDGLDIR